MINADTYINLKNKYPDSTKYSGWETDLALIKEYNKYLITRYPFLIPRDYCTGEVIEHYDLESPAYTLLDDMPDGWFRNFGEKLCEELNNALVDPRQYRILTIKEKYGQLRWYDNGHNPEAAKVIDKYERLSERTCIRCGKPAKWISQGWISPYCDDCKKADGDYETFKPLPTDAYVIQDIDTYSEAFDKYRD